MTDIRTRLTDALSEHRQGPGPVCRRCGIQRDAATYIEHLADVLLSLPGIAIVDAEELQQLRSDAAMWTATQGMYRKMSQ